MPPCIRPKGRTRALRKQRFAALHKRELSLDVLGEGQAILPGIFQQELAELLLRNWRFQIILAPLGVGAIEVGGAFLGVGLEADIRTGLHSRTYILGNLMETGACMHGFIAAVSRRARTVSKARDLITKKTVTMK
ncbi:MAG: hypothetical protein BHW51_03265 [Ruminococcus sp. CAG:9-related_41_34]|nr:MAG: hypothetical protein BHW51_03265 [Ruminococcus sp. CAG:9-related_41_34]